MPFTLYPFPELPEHENNRVEAGYERIKTVYDRGSRYLAQEEPDPLRIRVTADELMDLDDLMDALVQEVADDEWSRLLARSIVSMDVALRSAAEQMSTQYPFFIVCRPSELSELSSAVPEKTMSQLGPSHWSEQANEEGQRST